MIEALFAIVSSPVIYVPATTGLLTLSGVCARLAITTHRKR